MKLKKNFNKTSFTEAISGLVYKWLLYQNDVCFQTRKKKIFFKSQIETNDISLFIYLLFFNIRKFEITRYYIQKYSLR